MNFNFEPSWHWNQIKTIGNHSKNKYSKFVLPTSNWSSKSIIYSTNKSLNKELVMKISRILKYKYLHRISHPSRQKKQKTNTFAYIEWMKVSQVNSRGVANIFLSFFLLFHFMPSLYLFSTGFLDLDLNKNYKL